VSQRARWPGHPRRPPGTIRSSRAVDRDSPSAPFTAPVALQQSRILSTTSQRSQGIASEQGQTRLPDHKSTFEPLMSTFAPSPSTFAPAPTVKRAKVQTRRKRMSGLDATLEKATSTKPPCTRMKRGGFLWLGTWPFSLGPCRRTVRNRRRSGRWRELSPASEGKTVPAKKDGRKVSLPPVKS